MAYEPYSSSDSASSRPAEVAEPAAGSSDNKPSMSALDRQLRAAEANLEQEEARASRELAEGAAANVGNVEKIRDILFGGYIRDYEKRFRRLEERLALENQRVRDDLLQRLKNLEDALAHETDSLSEKLKTDRQERILGQQDLAQELNVLKNELNNRFAQVDEQVVKEVKQLRQQFHSRSQELASQLRLQGENLTGLIKQEVAQLQEEKVNRTDLAAFFTEFAFRLNRDLNPAGDNK
jgi:hypothetical protein